MYILDPVDIAGQFLEHDIDIFGCTGNIILGQIFSRGCLTEPADIKLKTALKAGNIPLNPDIIHLLKVLDPLIEIPDLCINDSRPVLKNIRLSCPPKAANRPDHSLSACRHPQHRTKC